MRHFARDCTGCWPSRAAKRSGVQQCLRPAEVPVGQRAQTEAG